MSLKKSFKYTFVSMEYWLIMVILNLLWKVGFTKRTSMDLFYTPSALLKVPIEPHDLETTMAMYRIVIVLGTMS